MIVSKFIRLLNRVFRHKMTPSELLEKKQREDYEFLCKHGVETEIGFVELIGQPIISCKQGGRIIIGKGVKLVSDNEYNIAGINHPVSLAAEGPNAIIIIEDGVGISGASIVTCSRIRIGADTLIGINCNIFGTDFHCISTADRLKQQKMSEAATAPIEIEERCWLGANVTVLKGVTIGQESIIGTMSLVNKNIPSHSIAAGVPAKVIKVVNNTSTP